jgi:hypothetical protein
MISSHAVHVGRAACMESCMEHVTCMGEACCMGEEAGSEQHMVGVLDGCVGRPVLR